MLIHENDRFTAHSTKNLQFEKTEDGQSVYRYLAGRGRTGQRFGVRFWEREGDFNRDQTLMMIVCKKWHVAKRLTEWIRQNSNRTAIDYLFNDTSTDLPDIGGIETTLEKRTRHSRAFVGLLFRHFRTDQLLICLDTDNFERIQDFFTDRPRTRVLFVDCDFSDEFLKGHATRIGLASSNSSDDVFAALLPAIRNDFEAEFERIRNAGLGNYFEIRQSASVGENTDSIVSFLDISRDHAQEIAQMPDLFAD